MLSSESMRIHEGYWLETFSGDLPVLALPTDFPRPSVQSFEGDAVTVRLGQPLHDQIHKIASEYGATLYMMLLAAYQVLLSKYSGQTDVIVGTPVAGRQLAETENILGMFVNTVAVRSQPESGKTFAQFLEEVKRSALLLWSTNIIRWRRLLINWSCARFKPKSAFRYGLQCAEPGNESFGVCRS